MSWYKILLNHEHAVENQGTIMTLCTEAFMRNAGVKNAALFADYNVGDPYVMYFSPAAVHICSNIISRYSGVPCNAPSASNVKLLAGHAKAWDLLEV